ncbi:MAG: sigma-70 family RNA polymerase sigma factor [Candidatus Thiothrix sulfatifontis]|nr:MAG: sigma-70 family RNA polymerase sigma factor [Candidatus Thiothrix sulfatifontis]
MAHDQAELYPLLAQVQRGDQQALGNFYDATVGRVYAIALKVTANPALAEEIVSDVYWQVWRAAGSYSAERATPLAWLLMMAHSRAIDALRKESATTKQQVELSDDFEAADPDTPNPLDLTLAVEADSALQTALQLLDAPQRQLIALAFYRGMSHQEIAAHTGEPLGTIKTQLRRAQAILRAALADSFPDRGVS